MRTSVPTWARMRGLLVLTVALCGCTTLADVSAGQVGCSPDEIAVTNEHATFSARTWTATCNGREYHCSSHGGGENSTPQVSCAPAQGMTTPGGTQPAPAEPGPRGCQFDTQCKGDRICEAVQCVSPPPAAAAPEPATTPSTPAESAPPPAPPAT